MSKNFPSVGQVVAFYGKCYPSAKSHYGPYAAIVAWANEDGSDESLCSKGHVNLTVFDEKGTTHPESNVLFAANASGDLNTPDCAYCSWVPAQGG